MVKIRGVMNFRAITPRNQSIAKNIQIFRADNGVERLRASCSFATWRLCARQSSQSESRTLAVAGIPNPNDPVPAITSGVRSNSLLDSGGDRAHSCRAMTGSLSAAELLRYSRHLLIPAVGEAGQLRLKNSSVLLVGAGALGSPAALYLTAAGIGRLGIVDSDTVDASNLFDRQYIGPISAADDAIAAATAASNGVTGNGSTYQYGSPRALFVSLSGQF